MASGLSGRACRRVLFVCDGLLQGFPIRIRQRGQALAVRIAESCGQCLREAEVGVARVDAAKEPFKN